MKISFISDTHGLFFLESISKKLTGGDILIHAGDCMNMGHELDELVLFFQWMSKQSYTHKILVPGNHDRLFELRTQEIIELGNRWGVHVLIDAPTVLEFERPILIYGSPWQPKFGNWAFNLPRNSSQLKKKWDMIPDNVDILITHGPPHSYLDYSLYGGVNVGCELLLKRVLQINPPIHVFGHIHSSYGTRSRGVTEFINASNLDSSYNFTNDPIHMIWDGAQNISYE